jgi:hypothetical protein
MQPLLRPVREGDHRRRLSRSTPAQRRTDCRSMAETRRGEALEALQLGQQDDRSDRIDAAEAAQPTHPLAVWLLRCASATAALVAPAGGTS